MLLVSEPGTAGQAGRNPCCFH